MPGFYGISALIVSASRCANKIREYVPCHRDLVVNGLIARALQAYVVNRNVCL